MIRVMTDYNMVSLNKFKMKYKERHDELESRIEEYTDFANNNKDKDFCLSISIPQGEAIKDNAVIMLSEIIDGEIYIVKYDSRI